ncbi:MAG: alpha/beta fold hydrolase [bacterium]|nr:alpha/beta fold hydrolase [bacterium]
MRSKKKSLIIIALFFILGLIAGLWYHGSWLTASTKNNPGDYIVLLHGLGRTSWSMHILGVRLAKQGYRIINANYPSTKDSIEHLSDTYLADALDRDYKDTTRRIHFVTHSMGGPMVRYFLTTHKIEHLGRAVMIAPPSKGSELADIWSASKRLSASMGPAIHEMTTYKNSLVNTLPPPYYEVGIIAGKRDEKISVENTKLEGMKDFLIVNREHTFIMIAKEVTDATIHFLKNGNFKPE